MMGMSRSSSGSLIALHAGRAARSLSFGTPVITLGVEPPLSAAGGSCGPPDARAVSLRWLAGTILTGAAGAALLGGAIVSTLQDGSEIVPAIRLAALDSPGRDALTSGGGKGDRLQAGQHIPNAAAAARQVMRVSETTRHGDREVVKMRPFVRVVAPLAQSPTEFASQVPPYDPMKIVTSAAAPDRAAPEAEAEGDLSFTVSDLAAIRIPVDQGPTVPPADVRARVREAAAFELASRYQTAQALPTMQSRLSYAADGPRLASIEARPVLPNMTLVPKSAGTAAAAPTAGENTTTVAVASPFAVALERDSGVAPDDARAVAERFAARDGYGLATVLAGQKLKVLMGRSAAPGLNRLQPVRVSLLDADGGHVGSVALSDMGDYVAIADPEDLADEPAADEEGADDAAAQAEVGRMRLYNGLYEAALRNNVPRAIIDEMVRIVSYDVDFNRPVGASDDFEVFFSDPNEPGGDGEVAYLSLRIGGDVRRFYRFETPDDGSADYYDESGKSAKKFLMRKPMNGGVMRSGFGFRRHPVLGYSKMHTGVDWAAPVGTPIVASGNGAVEKAGWTNGYGQQVRLGHANGYETTYNHMSRIGRGITAGASVRQGQVVGYVGSTGLSTGSHLHYEVLINGRFVNPMTIKLPRGRELDGETMAEFARERQRIDGLLGRGSTTAAKAAGERGG